MRSSYKPFETSRNNVVPCIILILCAGIALSFPSIAFSQQSPQPDLVTDRPDQTESASLVTAGAVQTEWGLLGSFSEGDRSSFALPSLLARIGLAEQFELRLGFDGLLVDEREDGSGREAFGAVTVGLKTGLLEESGILPQAVLIAGVVLPGVGDEAHAPKHAAAQLRMAFAHTLSERFGLGYNLGMTWNGFVADQTGVYTLACGYSATDAIGLFLEVFGYMPEGHTSIHLLDGGMTVLLSDDVQLDASAGVQYSGPGEEFFLSTGFTWRLWTGL